MNRLDRSEGNRIATRRARGAGTFLAALVAGCLALALPAAAGAAPGDLEITGTALLPPEFARKAAGDPPPNVRDPGAWGRRAAKRIVAAYQERGYAYARAWSGTTPDGTLLIDVDEGRMSGMVFLGASPQQAILFRVDVALPQDVLHRPTLERELKEIRTKYHLVSVDWRVEDREELIPNALGDPIALRTLRVIVVRADRHDWVIEANLDATFGLVPRGSYRGASLVVDEDRLELGLEIGVPYRRYLFDAEPRFTWVHGELGLDYRTPPFAGRRLVLSFEGTGEISRFDRADLRIRSYLLGAWSTLGNLQVQVVPGLFTMAFGFGVGSTHVFGLVPFPAEPELAEPEPPPGERSRFRYLLRLKADVDADPEGPMAGRKRHVRAQATLALDGAGRPMLDLFLRGRYEFSFGYHDLLFKARGVYLMGEVLFWDDQTLANECQRVFFGNRYWIRQAAQLEVSARFGVWRDKLKLGLFHDLSVFGDRTRRGVPVAVANGFGPSVHFLLFDQFRLDLYYGFGFAPHGFDHNFSMAFQSTF